ncbi:MAG: DUF2807 domain-containing protein [Phycisphaerae bacterium]|nr:DUF2807 domain-containing protein [Saprospiraceae bacterium]
MKISFLKKSTLLFSTLVLILGLQACDPFGVKSTGDLTTLNFDETDFHGLDLCLSANAEVRVGDEFKVEITCEESVMPYVETEVENGILKVYFSRNVFDVDHMKIVVTAPSWDHFDVSGSGDVEVLDAIEGQSLHLDVSGSGSISAIEAHFDVAELEVSGSGDLKLAGSADALDCDISGSGKIKCFDFLVNTADVEVSGSGDVQVNVNDKLDAEISGSGDIVYKGSPEVNARVSGSGSIKKF